MMNEHNCGSGFELGVGGTDTTHCRVIAIVVTFNPESLKLMRLLEAAAPQVYRILVIDNGSLDDVSNCLKDANICNCECMELANNVGIAAAANIGVAQSRALEASHLIFFDQDSEPAVDMIQQLLMAEQRLALCGLQVAAVGPTYIEENSGITAPFIRITRFGYKKFRPTLAQTEVETDFLIFSGALMPLAIFDKVGPMEEGLFIDWVDTEWCWRAQSLGYRVFGVSSATMHHTLGDGQIGIFNRRTPLHSPLRHYYIYRNAVLVLMRNYIPIRYKFYSILRLAARIPIYLLFASDSFSRLKMILRGIYHGIRRRSGPYQH